LDRNDLREGAEVAVFTVFTEESANRELRQTFFGGDRGAGTFLPLLGDARASVDRHRRGMIVLGKAEG